ncbi:MAG: hypothetical protein ACPHO6_10605 [Candidatus Latescibacterota bacterium]
MLVSIFCVSTGWAVLRGATTGEGTAGLVDLVVGFDVDDPEEIDGPLR